MKNPSKTRRGLGIAGLILAALALLGLRNVDWFLLKKSLRHKFANIEWISTGELADWLANTQRPAPVLLDVRTPEEWDVSHLPGARRIEPGAPADKLAERLRAAGFTNVRNLEGSIFQWANERRPLVRENTAVSQVHPYNSFWGRLLEDEVRAPLK
jgi:rhodanese-related sulfurtransferase